eukprot:2379762-Rhodomonas_salina.1
MWPLSAAASQVALLKCAFPMRFSILTNGVPLSGAMAASALIQNSEKVHVTLFDQGAASSLARAGRCRVLKQAMPRPGRSVGGRSSHRYAPPADHQIYRQRHLGFPPAKGLNCPVFGTELACGGLAGESTPRARTN